MSAKQIAGFLVAIIAAVPIRGWPQDDVTRFENESTRIVRYLESLGLNQRVIDYYEQQVATQQSAAVRKSIAERLADLYTEQILATGNGPEEMQLWQQRAANLIAVNPQLENPVLRVAIFHASYFAAVRRMEKWWSSRSETESSSQIAGEFRNLIRELRQYNERVQQTIEMLVELKQLQIEESQVVNGRILKNENALLHTRYLAAWSYYYLAVLSDADDRSTALRESDRLFREFLQIPDRKPIAELDASRFNLNSGWVIRGLVGLASSQSALRNSAQCDHLFQLVRSVSAKTEALADIWKFKALVYSGQNRRAENWAENFLTAGTSGNHAAWSEVLRLSFGIRDIALREQLLDKSLRGLARAMRADLIQELWPQNASAKDEFLSNWIEGLISLNRYARDRDGFALTDAQLKIERAVQLAKKDTDPVELASCQFLLARIYLQKTDFDRALSAIENAKRSLMTDPLIAPQLQWLEIECFVNKTRLEPRYANRALASIERLIRRFPNSPMISHAEFEKLKLELVGLPADQAIARLREIPTQNDHYADALFEMIRLQHQVWLVAATSDPDTADKNLQQLIEWQRTHWIHPKAPSQQKLKAVLIVVDTLLRGDPNSEMVLSLMQDADRVSKTIVDRNSAAIREYHYYELLVAEKLGRHDEAMNKAIWIAEFARDSRYEKPALIFLVKCFESKSKETGPDPDRNERLLQYYRRLRELISREGPTQNQNLLVVRSKLAECLYRDQQWTSAEAEYESLVREFPQQSSFLLGLARSRMKIGEYDTALNVWRKLAGGTSAGSSVWYEAKCGIIESLIQESPQAAGKILRQTRALSPEIPQPWANKFDQLESSLDLTGKTRD